MYILVQKDTAPGYTEEKIELGTSVFNIGRHQSNDLVLDDRLVSRFHARISFDGQEYWITDLGSANGVYINGHQITENVAYRLRNHDQISIGEHTLIFTDTLSTEEDLPTIVMGAPAEDFPSTATLATPEDFDFPEDDPWSTNYITGATKAIEKESEPEPAQTAKSKEDELPSPFYQFGPASQIPVAASPMPVPRQSPPVVAASQQNPVSRQQPIDSSVPTEQLRFSAFYPMIVPVERWQTLLVYTYIKSVLEQVRKDMQAFQQELGAMPGEIIAQAAQELARGTELTIVPTGPGIIFNPASFTIKWVEDWHRLQFRFLGHERLTNQAITGEIAIYAGPLLIATLRLALIFKEKEFVVPSNETTITTVSPYKKIFASYSHADTKIVVACSNVYKALGYTFVRDREILRSGQRWNETLLRLIDDADIFQLFWSGNAARSHYVQQEWQYALRNATNGFIRPVYWQNPIVPPPPELAALHFAQVTLPRLGLIDQFRLLRWSMRNMLSSER